MVDTFYKARLKRIRTYLMKKMCSKHREEVTTAGAKEAYENYLKCVDKINKYCEEKYPDIQHLQIYDYHLAMGTVFPSIDDDNYYKILDWANGSVISDTIDERLYRYISFLLFWHSLTLGKIFYSESNVDFTIVDGQSGPVGTGISSRFRINF